jgi:hypothetical protein
MGMRELSAEVDRIDATAALRSRSSKSDVRWSRGKQDLGPPINLGVILERARTAYADGDLATARKLALEILAQDPYHPGALGVATTASCALQDRIAAQIYYDRMPARNTAFKRAAAHICTTHSVKLVGTP